MWFITAVIALILGYAIYGKIVEKIFGPDPNRSVPAITKADGVDYVAMPTWKVWLIQLLNIAGIGPVFGPIMGALYGPTALLWIVLGSIFAGAVHDYMSGMLSMRYGGANIPAVVGNNLGSFAKKLMTVFALLLLLLVGTVFATSPAQLLVKLFKEELNMQVSFGLILGLIFFYYFVATLVPIDKLIGHIYPLFGALLIVACVGMTIAMFVEMPDRFYAWAEWGENQHPKQLPLWPLMFITIACGALSGFHSTQSPLMARCVRNECEGRKVFYGGMIAEGFIGLVWATVGMTFYPDVQTFANAGQPANVVYESSVAMMGLFGGILAILGVVVLPITSGDTAFRAARLTIAETFKYEQHKPAARLAIAIPVFIIGIILSQIDFNIIWRYFGWSNQTLAAIALFAGAAYLYRHGKFHWICTIPATFISAASIGYICWEPNMGLGMDIGTSNTIGAVGAVILLVCFIMFGKKPIKDAPAD
ncbi:MAG: carbon starvation protein A [Succinivibrio sp.]|nr:carbon starvation protein A [Succinivibrio sp.]